MYVAESRSIYFNLTLLVNCDNAWTWFFCQQTTDD